jgi:hypothetical protein
MTRQCFEYPQMNVFVVADRSLRFQRDPLSTKSSPTPLKTREEKTCLDKVVGAGYDLRTVLDRFQLLYVANLGFDLAFELLANVTN